MNRRQFLKGGLFGLFALTLPKIQTEEKPKAQIKLSKSDVLREKIQKKIYAFECEMKQPGWVYSKWMNGVTEYHLTAEEGMYYEVIRETMLSGNSNPDSKFDGINHLIDKENNDV